jgi:hypothetical protein
MLVPDLADLPERIGESGPVSVYTNQVPAPQEEADNDNTSGNALCDVDPEMEPHPVAPPAAEQQVTYVRAVEQEISTRRCCYFSDCQAMSQVCGGIRKGMCSFVNIGRRCGRWARISASKEESNEGSKSRGSARETPPKKDTQLAQRSLSKEGIQ